MMKKLWLSVPLCICLFGASMVPAQATTLTVQKFQITSTEEQTLKPWDGVDLTFTFYGLDEKLVGQKPLNQVAKDLVAGHGDKYGAKALTHVTVTKGGRVDLPEDYPDGIYALIEDGKTGRTKPAVFHLDKRLGAHQTLFLKNDETPLPEPPKPEPPKPEPPKPVPPEPKPEPTPEPEPVKPVEPASVPSVESPAGMTKPQVPFVERITKPLGRTGASIGLFGGIGTLCLAFGVLMRRRRNKDK